ncbi:MAG: hypothetical protein KGJ49_08380 [Alphaproteobacteria bacterium]|nr:hypothetical protein [Alphaproteobacteria bacterium]
MRLRVRMFVILCCFAVGVPSAYAGDVRFPQQGYPAISFHIPDGWTARVSEGNMIVHSADGSSNFSFSIVEFDGSLDELALAAMQMVKAAPPRRYATSVSGFGGYAYYSTMTGDAGAPLNVKMIAVKVDAKHVATGTLITDAHISKTNMATAETVLDGMSVVTSP